MRENVPRLGLEECRDFIPFYLDGILHRGLLAPLKEFGERSTGELRETLLGWYQLQIDGHPPESALELLVPAFPRELEILLGQGFRSSQLDRVLRDLERVLSAGHGVGDTKAALCDLAQSYPKTFPEILCLGCAERELDQIQKRARTESAREVILSQAASFFRQRYLSSQLIDLVVVAHPRTCETLRHALTALASGQGALPDGLDRVEKVSGTEYLLASGAQGLRIYFC